MTVLVLSLSDSHLFAEDSGAPSKRVRIMDLPQISVIDKLLSIEMSLAKAMGRYSEDAWADDYQALYARFRFDGGLSSIRGGGGDPVFVALALGVKASDAVMALKARNVEALKASADQVELLARNLGVTDAELGMANAVRRYAEDRQWFDAFSALGNLQRNVLAYLKKPENEGKRPLAALVIIGGWLQGGRCVTWVVGENYSDLVSNVLREGRLVALLQEQLETQLPSETLNHPFVQKLLGLFPEIHKRVNVGFDDPVPLEATKWLHKTFEDLVGLISAQQITSGQSSSRLSPVSKLVGTSGRTDIGGAIPDARAPTSEVGPALSIPDARAPTPPELGSSAPPNLPPTVPLIRPTGSEQRSVGEWSFLGLGLIVACCFLAWVAYRLRRA